MSTITARTRADVSRENGSKSRGPITPQGKAISSQNAVRSVIHANVLLKPEHKRQYQKFRRKLLQDLQPTTQLEALVAESVVECSWRLRTFIDIETEFVIRASRDNLASALNFYRNSTHLSVLARYQAGIERSLHRAIHRLQTLQNKNNQTNPEFEPKPAQKRTQNEPKNDLKQPRKTQNQHEKAQEKLPANQPLSPSSSPTLSPPNHHRHPSPTSDHSAPETSPRFVDQVLLGDLLQTLQPSC